MSYLFGGTSFDGYARDGRRSLNMGGGGSGSTQSSSTAYQTNIPEYAQPYVTSMLNATQQQLFNVQDGQVQGFAPYVPYSANPADYVAEFSPMQNQAFQSAANLQTPGQFGYGSDLASRAGSGALATTGQALGYGSMGSQFGSRGAEIGQGALTYGQRGADIGNFAAGTAGIGFNTGANYERMATDPRSIQAYMNPYVAASLSPQLQLMNQQLAQTQAQNQAQAVGQGAFGGSRQAVLQGLTQQNADLTKQQLIAQGYNTAFNQAQQAQQFGANLGLQGYQAGLGALQTGIQGQQTALQGIQGALAGTAQGMQGAQIGLQGVQGAQAGYGLANQAAGTMGQLGTQQLAAQQGIIGLQNQLGAQQQARQQQIINQAIQDYANAQQYPLMQLGTMSNMLRGLPLQSSTTQQYIAQPNMTTQAIGTLGAAGSLYGAMRKKGGIIDAKKMAKGGITSYDVGGAVEADLYDMPMERLQKELQSPSAEIRKKAKRIMAEKSIEGKAGGGIIAFAGGTPDPEVIPAEPAPQQTATDTQYQAPQAPVGPGRRDSAVTGNMRTPPQQLAGAGANNLEQALVAGYNQSLAAANRPVSEIRAELAANRAPDTARQEYRQQIMDERANLKDEDTRQNWLRAAAFFADWGSRPGNTLAAGMSALKTIIPDVISDQKEQKKYKREIDKILYGLDEAKRLEENGLTDKAWEIKQKLGEEGLKYLGPMSTIASAKVHAAATERAAAMRSSGSSGEKIAPLLQARNSLDDKIKSTEAALPETVKAYMGMDPNQEGISPKLKANIIQAQKVAAEKVAPLKEQLAQIDKIIDAHKTVAAAEAQQGGGSKGGEDAVTIDGRKVTRPTGFTDAQWSEYKKYAGAK